MTHATSPGEAAPAGGPGLWCPSPVPPWPPLRWRDDLVRRHLTAGTLLGLLVRMHAALGGGAATVDAADLLRELRRLALKYSGPSPGGGDGDPDDPDSWDPDDGPDPARAGGARGTLWDASREAAAASWPDGRRDRRSPDELRGEMLYTDGRDAAAVLGGLAEVCGVVRLDSPPRRGLKVRAAPTHSGLLVYERLVRSGATDPRLARSDPAEPLLVLDATFWSGPPADDLHPHTGVGDFDPAWGASLGWDPALATLPPPSADPSRSAAPKTPEREAARREAEAERTEDLLPRRRRSRKVPTYRQWLWLVRDAPLAVLAASTGLDPDVDTDWEEERVLAAARRGVEMLYVPHGSEPPALTERTAGELDSAGGSSESAAPPSRPGARLPGDPETTPLPRQWWTLRARLDYVRPFASAVLSGGPEGVWVAKPLSPWSVHNDTESFVAAGRPGFVPDPQDPGEPPMTARSSMAWETYAESVQPLSAYSEAKLALARAAAERETASFCAVRSERADAPLPAGAPPGASPGELRPAVGAAAHGAPLGARAERVAIRDASSALADASRTWSDARPHSPRLEVLSSPRPGALPAGVGQWVRQRCDFVYPATAAETGSPRDSLPCPKWSVAGSTRCELHGGVLLDPAESASVYRAGQEKLVSLGLRAIDVLGELMVNSTQDSVRLQAAKTVLDKAGWADVSEFVVHSEDSGYGGAVSPAEVVRQRLAALADGWAPQPLPPAPHEAGGAADEPLDAETDDGDGDGDGADGDGG